MSKGLENVTKVNPWWISRDINIDTSDEISTRLSKHNNTHGMTSGIGSETFEGLCPMKPQIKYKH